jgi:hypothetical protein
LAARGEAATLPNPPVATAADDWLIVDVAALANPPVVTAAADSLVREPLVRSKAPTSRGRSGAWTSTRRSTTGVAVGSSAAGAGRTGLAAIGVTATCFGTSVIAAWCTGGSKAGRAGGRAGSTAGQLNTVIDRGRAELFSKARVGTTAIKMPAIVAWTPTLSHRPVFARLRGRGLVPIRVSVNRSDMCRTDLKCRSMLLRRCSCL